VLADDTISDGAKILYGKIARLTYKTGYCWASNKFLANTQTERTIERQIKELEDAGYIKRCFNAEGTRQLYICEVDSRMEDTPPTETSAPPDKNVVQTLQDITNLKKQKKETEKSVFFETKENIKPPPEDKPIENKEDAAALFQKARLFWNEKGLKPECRDITMRCADTSEILRTFQHYTWAEIRNAIGNYYWHKTKAGPGYTDPLPYGSLAGFLKTGVEKYFDDDALDQQFKKEGK